MAILYMIVFMVIIFSLIKLMFNKRNGKDITLNLIGVYVGALSAAAIVIMS